MLLIFDWDGTLSDSTETIVTAMHRAAKDLRWRCPTREQVRNIIGLGLPEASQALYPGLTPDDSEQLRQCYSAHFIELDKQSPSAFYPGVRESLERLRAEGFKLAVATGKSRRGLDRILAALGLSDFFHATRCADETASKPNPQMLHELVQYFGVSAAQAVMVGDTEYDMEMAKRAGMARIAVSYGAHALERLRPYEPVLCMDEFAQLLSWEALWAPA